MPSEREAVLRERKAFLRGAKHAMAYRSDNFEGAAESFFALPKVERPRVVAEDATAEWSVMNGALVRRHPAYRDRPWSHWIEFRHCSDWAPTPQRVKLWSDLLTRPTELVDDDGSSGSLSLGGERT